MESGWDGRRAWWTASHRSELGRAPVRWERRGTLGGEPELQWCVRLHYSMWLESGEQVRAVDHVLADLARGVGEQVRRLEIVPGVGPVVALMAITVFADMQALRQCQARAQLRRTRPQHLPVRGL